MMSKTLILSSAALFASMFAATGFALEKPDDAGKIAAEATAAAADTAGEVVATETFTTLDANADGMISAEEAQSNSTLMTRSIRTMCRKSKIFMKN